MFSFPFGSFNNNFFPLANKLCGTWNVILRQLTKVFQAIYCVLLSFPLEGRFLSPSTLFVGMLIFYIFVAFISGTLKKKYQFVSSSNFLGECKLERLRPKCAILECNNLEIRNNLFSRIILFSVVGTKLMRGKYWFEFDLAISTLHNRWLSCHY